MPSHAPILAFELAKENFTTLLLSSNTEDIHTFVNMRRDSKTKQNNKAKKGKKRDVDEHQRKPKLGIFIWKHVYDFCFSLFGK